MHIIGINGLMGSGKDTLGDVFVKDHEYKKVSFAAALKDCVAAAYNWPRDMLEGDTEESRNWREEVCPTWKETPRSVLQQVGVMFREKDPDFWVKALKATLDPEGWYVVTDMRFPNEFQAIQDLGGRTIRVWGPEHVSDGRIEVPSWILHTRAYNLQQELYGKVFAATGEAVRDLDIHVSEWAACHIETDEVYLNEESKDFKHNARMFAMGRAGY